MARRLRFRSREPRFEPARRSSTRGDPLSLPDRGDKPMRTLTLFSLSLPAAILLALSACSDNGSADKVGQKIDKAADSAKEKMADAVDSARRDAKQAGATFDDVA